MLAEKFATDTVGNTNVSLETKNIAVSVNTVTKNDIVIRAYDFNSKITNDVTTKLDSNIPGTLLAAIEIPKETFSRKIEVVISYCFKKSSLFINDGGLNASIRNTDSKIVQSVILSASILQSSTSNLISPIKLKFQKIYEINRTGINSCGFWNFSQGTVLIISVVCHILI